MNEEQLIEFINWLPSIVPEFKDATPDQIVQTLNQMSESDEGQQMLSQLINTFQQAKQSADSQMFKKGGKLEAFVSKYGRGGEMCCKKKAILQGGMVNKISEKMQDGGEIVATVPTSSLGYNPYGIMDKIGTSGGLQQTPGRKAIKSIILDNAQRNGQTLSRKDLRQQTKAANFVNRAQEGLIGENRLNRKLPQMLDVVDSIPVAQEGGELATMISAETANNIGLIPKAQDGLITPEVKPSGLRGLFWKAKKYPRLDSGVEGDTPWTGTRSVYYNQDGDLIQSITKKYKNGSEYTTTMEVENPFTPVADTLFINTGGDVAWGRKTPKQLRAKKDSDYGNVFNRVMSGLRNNILIEPPKKDK